MDKPIRAVVLNARIEADTRNDLVIHLLNLATQIDRGELGQSSISGGYSSGHIIDLAENDGPSHNEYAHRLHAYVCSLSERGRIRNWYIDKDGIKRWADTDKAVEAVNEESGDGTEV